MFSPWPRSHDNAKLIHQGAAEMHHSITTLRCLVALLLVSVAAGAAESSSHAPQPIRKVLVMGNSLTRHAPSPTLGWQGDWGMAATARERDFAHLLHERLCRFQPDPRPELIIESLNARQFPSKVDQFPRLAAHNADLIIIQIGDNLPESEATLETLGRPYEQLLMALKKGRHPLIYGVGVWGGGPKRNALMKEACDRQGAGFITIHHLFPNRNNRAASEGHFTHAGVNWHPGDRGMQAIAEALWQAIRPTGMTLLHYADPRFIAGLKKHDLLADYGLRLLSTGFKLEPFGKRWSASPLLAEARASGRDYYIDRITGGMPYQPLDGIEEMAATLKNDPHFLGFQVHEWDNSPLADYHRIRQYFIDKKLPFDQEHFRRYEGRTEFPFFSGGNFRTYQNLYRPLKSRQDVEAYLDAYFRHLLKRTAGQIMSVNGNVQFPHTALRLGAKNVMAEIGNQVPLTALQVACVRGAARQYHKPFGLYYETWGGKPFGCVRAMKSSPWFDNDEQMVALTKTWQIGPQYGSSRSLQRRLIFFAWLSGADYWAEEWEPENYFANWTDYPLTDYGRVTRTFLDVSGRFGRVEPVVPAAVVAPPGTFGVDVCYLGQARNDQYGLVQPDDLHRGLRGFAAELLASRPPRAGADDYNLTPSPWIGCFDVVSAEAPPELLAAYGLLIYFDRKQADASGRPQDKVLVFEDPKRDAPRCIDALRRLLPIHVEGEVGSALARTKGRYILGVFNNLGVTKTDAGEHLDPNATRTVTVHGPSEGLDCPLGREYLAETRPDLTTLRLPAGAVAVLSLPNPKR